MSVFFAIYERRPPQHSAAIPHERVEALDSKSIAVLPFLDLSQSRDQQYFADGLAEEVIDLLARRPGLQVVGRTSSFQFRDKATDVRAIGTALGATYVLEGSIRRSADKIRVTAQLIDARDGHHTWSNSYDSGIDDILNVQDAMASGIARALELTVQNIHIHRGSTANPEAYELYLRALQLIDTYRMRDLEQAIATLEQALKLDPDFVRAHVAIARAYGYIGENAGMPTHVAFERARAAALRALSMDKQNAAAHIWLAHVHLIYDWDWKSAEREIATAFQLGVRDTDSLLLAGRLATVQGDWDRAAMLIRQVIASDPLNPFGHFVLGWQVYARTGRLPDAEDSIRRALQISPNYAAAKYFLATTVMLQGRLPEALALAKQETSDDGQLEGSAMILHAMKRAKDSDTVLAQAIAHNGSSWASAIAKVYAYRQQPDKALEWLEHAYAQKDEDLYFILGDPLLDNLAGVPGYAAFLKRMGFEINR